MTMSKTNKLTGLEIAVVGMAGKFPGASNVEEFWENIRDGKESISYFTEEELAEPHMDQTLVNDPNYVPCKGGVLEGKEYFDAGFFKYSADEAELLSPQTRLFHETVWEAVEEAGYNIRGYKGSIGLYAGASSGFMWEALAKFSGGKFSVNDFFTTILSGKEFLCTQTSYKLNLKGPSINVQTACSTALAAIHTASRALLTGECQMALAGGVSLSHNQQGHLYEEGMISSKDGHIRAFDKDASGVVNGEGVGVVVLKLLKKAIKDGDHIHAVIKGGFANNDGDEKVGYTAPGVGGQSKAILSALRISQVEPESISYVETHGTATPLGDVTEIEALKQAFGTKKRNYCALGSVKTNIGHLDAAAGIAGFLKTVMALKNNQLPPSLHFESPNPSIDFVNSPFFVNAKLTEWKSHEFPLRAGVSSFGMGGTNVHLILEEYKEENTSGSGKNDQLIMLSAKSKTALDAMTLNLGLALKENPSLNLADTAYTLQVGREAFSHRRKFVCKNREEAIEILSDSESRKIQTTRIFGDKKKVAFMFSGMGAQYHEMCKDLLKSEPTFKEEVELCAKVIQEVTGCDIMDVMYGEKRSDEYYHQMDIGQYIVFTIEYAMAKLLMSFGINPDCMIGYSFGEFVAACFSGVFSLKDTIALIQKRGELILKLEEGSMMSVPMSVQDVQSFIGEGIHLAIDNGESCVLSGKTARLDELEKQLREDRILCIRMAATRAVHSKLMEPVGNELKEFLKTISIQTPIIPYISNVTGDWIRASDAKDPAYWVAHLCQTVEFSKGVDTLLRQDGILCIEIGPGSDIATLVNRKLVELEVNEKAVNVIRPEVSKVEDARYLTNRIGFLWSRGVKIDWAAYHQHETRKRVSLPTYPFERNRFWKLMDSYTNGEISLSGQSGIKNVEDWFYVPTWKRGNALNGTSSTVSTEEKTLVFKDQNEFLDQLYLKNEDQSFIRVTAHTEFCKFDQYNYGIDITSAQDYEQLFKELVADNNVPKKIIHAFTLSESTDCKPSDNLLIQESGYYSLLNITQSIVALAIEEAIHIDVISNGLFEVLGNETLNPLKNTLLGTIKVIPQEISNVTCRLIDLELDVKPSELKMDTISEVLNMSIDDNLIAVRSGYVWRPDFEPRKMASGDAQVTRFKEKGVYVITGGLGGVALEISKFLVEKYNARLCLLSRSKFPERDQWSSENSGSDLTSERIRHIQEIEQLGGEVFVLQADVSERNDIKASLELIKSQFGKIDGLIHAATIPDGSLIAVREKKMSEEMFKVKLDGTLLLDELLHDEQLDFIYYFSTLSAVLGGFGQVGYAAANAFLDAYAQYQTSKGKTAVSINWDRWRGVGIARIGEARHLELSDSELVGGMMTKQAVSCFESISREPRLPAQIAVSQTDLIEDLVFSNTKQDFEIDESGLVDVVNIEDRIQRPDLSTDYTEPSNELEEKLATLWIVFFGIREIGVNDNFFELGGDSLKGMVLLKRMKKEINVEMSIKELFAHPTIKGISDEINDVKRLLETKERSSTITI